MKIKLSHFLEKFPKIELPVTLSEESHHGFSKENDPLPAEMILEYITHYEASEPDEFTEYIACFQLPLEKKTYSAVIYWKAGLLNYDYVLATYDKKIGSMIDKRAIAGTRVVGNNIKLAVAIIKEDMSIHIAEGVEEGADYDADSAGYAGRRAELGGRAPGRGRCHGGLP